MSVLLSCIAALLLLLVAAPTQAQTPPPRPLRVALSPHVTALERDPGAQPDAIITSLRSGASRYLATHPDLFDLINEDELLTRLRAQPLYQQRVTFGDQLAEQGIQEYRELVFNRAIEHMEQALDHYLAVREDLARPGHVASVMFYLALCYLEQGQNFVRPLQLVRLLLLLDPKLAFQPGYYAERVVSFYQEARANLARALQQRGPRAEHIELARAMATALDADVVIYLLLLPEDGGGYEVAAYPYWVRDGRFDSGVKIALDVPDPEAAFDAADRLMSQLASCLYQPDPIVSAGPRPSQGDSPFSVALNFSYASFLRYPNEIKRYPYGNYGLGLGTRWLLTREFGLVGNFQMLIAQKDYSGLVLTDDFATFRSFFGGELGLLTGDLAVAIQVTGELTRVSRFEVWSDVTCPARPNCTDRQKTTYAHDLMLGVNARPVLSYRMFKSLEILGAVSMSYFFYATPDASLNFPLSGELGLQYRF